MFHPKEMEKRELMRSMTLLQTKIPGLRWFIWLPLVVLIDQISKWFVIRHLSLHDVIPLFPGLRVTLSHNTGIAFSLFSSSNSHQQILLLAVILIISTIMGVWLAKTPYEDKWSGVALVFIFGGALGNLCDRIWHGYVIDFIDFYIGNWHFYTFNLADSFVSIGAAMLIFSTLFCPADKD